MKFILSILIILSLASCKDNSLNIKISPEEQKSSWWMRADFFPNGKEVRGIPISKISKDWCAANEFTNDQFKNKLTPEEFKQLSSFSFEAQGKFDGIHEIKIISGVFKKCNGDRGNFVLSLDSVSKNNNTILDVTEVSLNNAPHYMAINTTANPDEIEIWWCHACDVYDLLKWDANKHGFVGVPFEEPGFTDE